MFKKADYIRKVINKSKNDNFYSRVFYRKLSPYLTLLFLKFDIHPHTITWLSVIFALIGSFLISFSDFTVTLIGFVFFQLWYLLDHVDGEVARIKHKSSIEGVYLDVVTHYLVHPIIFFSFGLDAVNYLPRLQTIPLIDLTITPRRIILFLSFIAGLSSSIIDLSSALRYSVLISKSKFEKLSAKYSRVILRLRNVYPVSFKSSHFNLWRILWNVFCIPGAVWFLTLGALLKINFLLIPLYAGFLSIVAIMSIIVRLRAKIDTIY